MSSTLSVRSIMKPMEEERQQLHHMDGQQSLEDCEYYSSFDTDGQDEETLNGNSILVCDPKSKLKI